MNICIKVNYKKFKSPLYLVQNYIIILFRNNIKKKNPKMGETMSVCSAKSDILN